MSILKLTKAQQEIVDLMRDGWELAVRDGAFIQKGGAGRGGEYRKVHSSTFDGLYKKGALKDTSPSIFHQPRTYKLTKEFA